MSTNSAEVIIEIILCVLSCIFGCVLILRHQTLKTVARQNSGQITKRVRNGRILLQILNILQYISLMILQALSDYESEYDRLYTLLWVPVILVCIVQISVECHEFTMRIPLMFQHYFFWVAQFLCAIADTIAYFIEEKDQRFSVQIIAITRCIFQLSIVVYTIWRQQDISEFLDISLPLIQADPSLIQQQVVDWRASTYNPPMNQQEQDERNISPQEFQSDQKFQLVQSTSSQNYPSYYQFLQQHSKLTVKFLSSITVKAGLAHFKIHVIASPCQTNSTNVDVQNDQPHHSQHVLKELQYEISKELNEFVQLQDDIIKETEVDFYTSDSTLLEIQAINLRCYQSGQINQTQTLELRTKLQELLDVLASNHTHYYAAFLDFLKLPPVYKRYYLALSPTRTKSGRLVYSTVQTKLNESIIHSDRKHADFFSVQINNSREQSAEIVRYEVKIRNLQNNQKYELTMRFRELRQLHANLKDRIGKTPQFPPRKIISATNEKSISERRDQLKLYLEILLNEVEYVTKTQLWELLLSPRDFNDSLVREIFIDQRHLSDYSQWEVKGDGYFIQMQSNEMKSFTVYRFTVFEGHTKKGNIEKRFKEFVKLHELLENKFDNSSLYLNVQLPDLPSRVSALKTSVPKDKRQKKLIEYINHLFAIPDIGESYCFRQFFAEVDPQMEEQKNESDRNSTGKQRRRSSQQKKRESHLMKKDKSIHEDALFGDDNRDEQHKLNCSSSSCDEDKKRKKESDATDNQDNQDNNLSSLQIDELQQFANRTSPTTVNPLPYSN